MTDNNEIIIFDGRLSIVGKYDLCRITLTKSVHEAHLNNGLSNDQIKELYIDKFKNRK